MCIDYSDSDWGLNPPRDVLLYNNRPDIAASPPRRGRGLWLSPPRRGRGLELPLPPMAIPTMTIDTPPDRGRGFRTSPPKRDRGLWNLPTGKERGLRPPSSECPGTPPLLVGTRAQPWGWVGWPCLKQERYLNLAIPRITSSSAL